MVQDKLFAHANSIAEFGPSLKRPLVGTLNGSKHANMKELRFDADHGVWRVAFAFDPDRKGVFHVADDRSGKSEKRFYRQLIDRADERFDNNLAELKNKGRR